ncbi:apelin receptor B-like [Carcharodon carcharias]|uniref:apelin receptor B-like n=1 Tax=Carcharodon carcharias TaxID=13397 RepID=UPI001B7F1D6E|nr:apelin receptor B-like [Carcharodon carcharias]
MESFYDQLMFVNDSEISYNDTECPLSEWEPSYVLIPCIYLLVFVLGLAGNGTVIWASWQPRAQRKSADAFIAHLALADLTFVLTLPLWAAYAARGYRWPFGPVLCKLSSYLVLLNMYSSVFCLTCLSVDRYQAIVGSAAGAGGGRSPRRGPRKRGLWLAASWASAGVLALPALVFRGAVELPWGGEEEEVEEVGGGGGPQTVCDMDLSPLGQDEEVQAAWLAAFGLSSTSFGFLLPFAVMASCYGLVGSALSSHFQGGGARRRRRRRRLLSVILSLVLAFGLCWLPFHLLKTLVTLDGLALLELPCGLRALAAVAHPYTTCLAYVNSCLNPLLYAWLDPDFRARCRRSLRRLRPAAAAAAAAGWRGERRNSSSNSSSSRRRSAGAPSPEPSATRSSSSSSSNTLSARRSLSQPEEGRGKIEQSRALFSGKEKAEGVT